MKQHRARTEHWTQPGCDLLRCPPRRSLRLLFTSALALAVLLGAGSAAHAQCGNLPPGAEAAMVPSTFLGGPDPVVVYLPPDYAAGMRRYPVVYWFHGRGDNQCTQLPILKNVQEAIQSGAAAPMIYVFINGGSGCNFDDTACAGKKVESYVMKELMPYIDAHYRTVPGPGGRAIEGFSMGAEAVLRYFNKYAAEICDAVAYAPIGGSALTQATLDAAKAKSGPALRLVVGTADNAHLPGTRNYEKMLMAIQFSHEYEELPGVAHNPFALYGAQGGMVGRRGLAMHTRCFAAAVGTDGGVPGAGDGDAAAPADAQPGPSGGGGAGSTGGAGGGADGAGGAVASGGAGAAGAGGTSTGGTASGGSGGNGSGASPGSGGNSGSAGSPARASTPPSGGCAFTAPDTGRSDRFVAAYVLGFALLVTRRRGHRRGRGTP